MLRTLVIVAGLCVVLAAKLPSHINKCSKSDPNFSACVLKEARNLAPSFMQGNRKLNLPPLDPLVVTEMSVAQSGTVGLNFTLKDVRITGMADLKFADDLSWDLAKRTLKYALQVPRLEMTGGYSMKGRIMILPISGQGPLNVTLVDSWMNVSSSYDLETHDDGLEYFNFHPTKLTFTPKKAYIELSNLFNGDPILGPQTNLFLNDNWQEIIKEVGPSVAEGISSAVLQTLKGLAEKYPYEEFFLP